jgi:hypothetical protein
MGRRSPAVTLRWAALATVVLTPGSSEARPAAAEPPATSARIVAVRNVEIVTVPGARIPKGTLQPDGQWFVWHDHTSEIPEDFQYQK